jgi:hypothetical protein
MKSRWRTIIFVLIFIPLISCKQKETALEMNIAFLHHSTGLAIWNGRPSSGISRFVRSKSNRIANLIGVKAQLPALINEYNKTHSKHYLIKEIAFPNKPYAWVNYPFDYYNIWVKNAGDASFMEQPTLEMLTKEYQVIVFKHCFPVSNIQTEADSSDINSDIKTISNYKLQYLALRDKLLKFPNTKFIVFTGAAQVKSGITEGEAERAKEFFNWVVNKWELPNDNIYLWDFYGIQTEGGLYFKDEYAVSPNNSHPNEEFAGRAAVLLFNRIIDVIEKDGHGTTLKGDY